MTLPSHCPKLVNVGRQHFDDDALDGPVGVRLRDLPGGPVTAMVVVIAKTVRWDPADGLVTPDFGGFIASAGTAFEAPNASDLRTVAAMPGAAVDVFLLAPAEADKAT
ncbi:hypothetical protein [Methylobacterium aerolatum]|uniref:Uncharacterized protein n=1 Tax=Methylobacterium aerolatum TaxID=418708 RepID=A0ABU0I2Z4_9HYPH|nr:hypothetical protein [Methylobacterium aerolatum]MDQ0448049.1 hypothetical protein [Methylobacterium aerolatum]GJD36480.1 hypothetical protein FMGBMHLM_3400 [Methylobacterium aerolatum]